MVFFGNPVDGGAPAPLDRSPLHRWTREGETFDDLTLTEALCVRDGHGTWRVVGGEVVAA
jgi:hypothetical protein